MMDIHAHIYDLDSPELDLVDEKDVVVQDLYEDDRYNVQDGYIQYIIDSEQLPSRSIEVRIPVSWIKPELIEQLKQSWNAQA